MSLFDPISGQDSLFTAGKRTPKMAQENVRELRSAGDEEAEEDLDESLLERLWGLTEMFPEPLQKGFGNLLSFSSFILKSSVSLGRSALWIACSSATIMVLPVIFESERAQQQEQQLQQQRQILLGPNAAVSGAGSHNLLPGMGMMPPGMAIPK